jgi:hypothetical protein
VRYDFTPEAATINGACPLFRRRRDQNAVPSHFVNDPLKFLAKSEISAVDGIIL